MGQRPVEVALRAAAERMCRDWKCIKPPRVSRSHSMQSWCHCHCRASYSRPSSPVRSAAAAVRTAVWRLSVSNWEQEETAAAASAASDRAPRGRERTHTQWCRTCGGTWSGLVCDCGAMKPRRENRPSVGFRAAHSVRSSPDGRPDSSGWLHTHCPSIAGTCQAGHWCVQVAPPLVVEVAHAARADSQ
jgi:hypothetical protein